LIDDIGFREYVRICAFGTANSNFLADSQCHQILGNQHFTGIISQAEQFLRTNVE